MFGSRSSRDGRSLRELPHGDYSLRPRIVSNRRSLIHGAAVPIMKIVIGSQPTTTETGRRDIVRLFSTRIIRLFCYGFLSVVLALYLAQAGLREQQIGLLFTLTLAGDAAVTLWLTTRADRFGRKRTLIAGAMLMFGAGAVFILTRDVVVLMAAAIIGVISPSGNEIGPF